MWLSSTPFLVVVADVSPRPGCRLVASDSWVGGPAGLGVLLVQMAMALVSLQEVELR